MAAMIRLSGRAFPRSISKYPCSGPPNPAKAPNNAATILVAFLISAHLSLSGCRYPDCIPDAWTIYFSTSAIAVAQEVMASQSRKSPTGALTFLIVHFSTALIFFTSSAPWKTAMSRGWMWSMMGCSALG